MTRRPSPARSRNSRFRLAVVGLLGLSLLLTACSDDKEPAKKPKASPTVSVAKVSLGVYGHPEELAEYQRIVADFNNDNPLTKVTLTTWDSPEQASEAQLSGESLPDAFLSDYDDLDDLLRAQRIRPVSDLMDERGISFGDNFARTALQGFGADGELQCLPYEMSPSVVFINTDLVDFDKIAARGLPVPTRPDRWSLGTFAAAAQFAARPRKGIKAFAFEPNLTTLAPFVLSGGGKLFDDDSITATPTSLAFSDDSSRDALQRTLEVFRDPRWSITQEQLNEATPLEWFKKGKVAMIIGTHELLPELRKVTGLNFDVKALPAVDRTTTLAQMSGLCISADTKDPNATADVVAALSSDDSVSRIAALGYLAPANLAVAGSEAVRTPSQMPATAIAFYNSLRTVMVPPRVPDWAALEEQVRPYLEQLLFDEPTLDLEGVTTALDESSRLLLDPQVTASPSNSPSDSVSGSPEPEETP